MNAVGNPFDRADGRFLVLADGRERHSLWPAGTPVPTGWHVVHDEDDRDACLRFVETSGTGPASGMNSSRPGA